MPTNKLIDLLMSIYGVGLSCALLFLIGFLAMKILTDHKETKRIAIQEKHKRIVEGDDLINEYEIGREWADN